jgi:3-oxoacyl-[acyl-carrier protein] reductase
VRLTGKVALITGGGTGIGRAISLRFAGEGADLIVNYSKRAKEAEEVVEASHRLGVRALPVRADVSRDVEARRLAAETVELLGRIDILVNNAGWSTVIPHRDLEALTEEILEKTWAVNTKGPLYMCRAVIPQMLKQGGGRIVNTTSVSAFQGAGSSIIYGASKAACTAITKSLARVYARDNILVNAVAPGFVNTGFAGLTSDFMEKLGKVTPIGRLPTVEEVANAALFLAADASGITAQTIFVDCGVTVLQPMV